MINQLTWNFCGCENTDTGDTEDTYYFTPQFTPQRRKLLLLQKQELRCACRPLSAITRALHGFSDFLIESLENLGPAC